MFDTCYKPKIGDWILITDWRAALLPYDYNNKIFKVFKIDRGTPTFIDDIGMTWRAWGNSYKILTEEEAIAYII